MMLRNTIFALVLGLSGAGVLIGLGIWQLQRLQWKEGIIAGAEAMIAAEPVWLSGAKPPEPQEDRYRSVKVIGRFTGEEAHVLTSSRESGPGFLVIAVFEMGSDMPRAYPGPRRILIDRGFVPEAEKSTPRPVMDAQFVTGNLNWPDDVTPSTPPYDDEREIWYGRDVAGIAALLGTEPTLIIARSDTGDGITPQPVTVAGFRNNHWQYAVTWFSLAAVWLGMTVFLLWRIRFRTV
jgi:surfeit locus 1 family protein